MAWRRLRAQTGPTLLKSHKRLRAWGSPFRSTRAAAEIVWVWSPRRFPYKRRQVHSQAARARRATRSASAHPAAGGGSPVRPWLVGVGLEDGLGLGALRTRLVPRDEPECPRISAGVRGFHSIFLGRHRVSLHQNVAFAWPPGPKSAVPIAWHEAKGSDAPNGFPSEPEARGARANNSRARPRLRMRERGPPAGVPWGGTARSPAAARG